MLHLMADASPMAVIMLDREGAVALWNESAGRIFGWNSAEVTGRFLPIVPHDRQDDFWEHFNKLLAGGRISELERPALRKDGKIIDISIAAAPMRGARGEILSIMVIAADISDRKRLEKEFLQAQKMEAVGRLAGGVAHDFNNLLTAIDGYSTFLLSNIRPEDPNRADVEEIKKAGERAADLTRQLLAFSRQQMLQPKVLDCNAVISGIEKMLRRLIGEDIQVATRLQPELGRVLADAGQLEQVIMNLVVNSRDAMPDGGRITIATSDATLDAERARPLPGIQPGRYVMISVNDTGHGMDAQTQARLFEPFFTTKKLGKGTGLGLATVYGIVKQSGGSIYVESEPVYGTTFKIFLPRVEGAMEAGVESGRSKPSLRGTETILLVEDDEGVHKLLHRVLAQSGYSVLSSRFPLEAIKLCENHPGDVHLMITDMVMPEMHGRELAHRLASVRSNMKVLYMSGYTDPEVVRQALLDESAGFMQKPVTPESMLRKIRGILDGGERH